MWNNASHLSAFFALLSLFGPIVRSGISFRDGRSGFVSWLATGWSKISVEESVIRFYSHFVINHPTPEPKDKHLSAQPLLSKPTQHEINNYSAAIHHYFLTCLSVSLASIFFQRTK